MEINNTPIPVPSSLQDLLDKSGPFGENIIQLGISTLLFLALILALFFLIWNGYYWMISEGNKENIDKARQGVIYSVIGLAVVLFSFMLINLLSYFFGVDLIKK